jgi:hypothetical protein
LLALNAKKKKVDKPKASPVSNYLYHAFGLFLFDDAIQPNGVGIDKHIS